MVSDATRTRPFVEALRRHVTPDSVVLDIGTGTGFFAMLASQLGARRVFAVEPDDSIEVARLCAAGQPGCERIEWIRGLTTEMDLPERADIVIGDLHGVLPFYVGNIPSMIDARKRLLKPGGRMMPRRDTVWVAPAQAPGEYRQIQDPWDGNDYGVDMSAGRRFVANHWWRAAGEQVAPDAFLAEPGRWVELDYGRIEEHNVSAAIDWRVARAGTLHGYYVWFDCEVDEGLGSSNSPLLPELVYGRGFFPLERPVEVAVGDGIHAQLSANLVSGRYVMRWDSEIRRAGQEPVRFRQSSFKSQVHRKSEFDRGAPGFQPELTDDGYIDLAVLEGMSRGESLQAIAATLAGRHGKRFASVDDALGHVARLSRKYARAPGA